MLEQAPACIKQAGRQIAKATQPRSRTRHSLHHSFWCHGAADIALPAWWIETFYQKPRAGKVSRQRNAHSAKGCLAAGLAGDGFLDFLYPAKTLILIHKLAARKIPIRKGYYHVHLTHATPRTFFNGAAETRVAREGDRRTRKALIQNGQETQHDRPATDVSSVGAQPVLLPSGPGSSPSIRGNLNDTCDHGLPPVALGSETEAIQPKAVNISRGEQRAGNILSEESPWQEPPIELAHSFAPPVFSDLNGAEAMRLDQILSLEPDLSFEGLQSQIQEIEDTIAEKVKRTKSYETQLHENKIRKHKRQAKERKIRKHKRQAEETMNRAKSVHSRRNDSATERLYIPVAYNHVDDGHDQLARLSLPDIGARSRKEHDGRQGVDWVSRIERMSSVPPTSVGRIFSWLSPNEVAKLDVLQALNGTLDFEGLEDRLRAIEMAFARRLHKRKMVETRRFLRPVPQSSSEPPKHHFESTLTKPLRFVLDATQEQYSDRVNDKILECLGISTESLFRATLRAVTEYDMDEMSKQFDGRVNLKSQLEDAVATSTMRKSKEKEDSTCFSTDADGETSLGHTTPNTMKSATSFKPAIPSPQMMRRNVEIPKHLAEEIEKLSFVAFSATAVDNSPSPERVQSEEGVQRFEDQVSRLDAQLESLQQTKRQISNILEDPAELAFRLTEIQRLENETQTQRTMASLRLRVIFVREGDKYGLRVDAAEPAPKRKGTTTRATQVFQSPAQTWPQACEDGISQRRRRLLSKGMLPIFLDPYLQALRVFEEDMQALIEPDEADELVARPELRKEVDAANDVLQKGFELAQFYSEQYLDLYPALVSPTDQDVEMALQASFFLNDQPRGRLCILAVTKIARYRRVLSKLHHLTATFANWDFTAAMWLEWTKHKESQAFWGPVGNTKIQQLLRASEDASFSRPKDVTSPAIHSKVVLRCYLRRFLKHVLMHAPPHAFRLNIYDRLWKFVKRLSAPGKVFYRLALDVTTSKAKHGQPQWTIRAYALWKKACANEFFRIDRVTLENLVISMCRSKHSKSLHLFHDWVNSFGEPSPALFDSCVRALLSLRHVEEALELLRDYPSLYDHAALSDYLAALITAYGERGEVWAAETLFRSLESDYEISPTVHHWNSFAQVFSSLGRSEAVEDLLREMQQLGVDSNVDTSLIQLRAYAVNGDLERLYAWLKQLREQGLPLDARIVECLVEAYTENQAFEAAEQIIMGAEGIGVVGSRTHYWNILLKGYALVGKLRQAQGLLARMEEAAISLDEQTCAALMIAYSTRRVPASGARFMQRFLRAHKLRPSTSHYNALMLGFIITQEYSNALGCFEAMERKQIEPNHESKLLAIRATARLDRADFDASLDRHERTIHLSRAEELLDSFLETSDPCDVVTDFSIFGTAPERREDYLSEYFDELMHIYGEFHIPDKVAKLHERYTSALRMNHPRATEVTPPIHMIASLMNNARVQKQWDEVDRLWAQARTKATEVARRKGADVSQPGWVLPKRHLILARPLHQLMRALAVQRRHADLDMLVDRLYTDGFALDNQAMNLYVQNLALGRGDDAAASLRAFTLAETELMDGWIGWPKDSFYGGQQLRQPPVNEPNRRFPDYMTMVSLAAAYVHIRNQGSTAFQMNEKLRQVMVIAPRTVESITSMPRISDQYQDALLGPGRGWDHA